MTVAEAAAVWEESKRILEEHEPRLKAAADVLKEYFRRTGKADYKGRVGYARTTYLALDQDLVKAELGEDLSAFKTRREREQLSLLKD